MHLIKRGLQFPEEKKESKQKPSLEIGSQFRKQVIQEHAGAFFSLKATFSIQHTYVVYDVNFLSQVIFVFLLFLGMVMYTNEVELKGK